MIQRTLLRGSRAVGYGARAYRIPSSRLSSPSPLLQPFASRRQDLTSRWYSATAETGKGAEGESPASQERSTEQKEDDTLKKQLEAKNKEVIDLKDKYLRSVADFRNLQDRTKRDVQSAKDFAIQRFAKDLIESIDNLDRALETAPKEALEVKSEEVETTNKDFLNLYNGLKMTETILLQTLQKHGLKRFDPSIEGEKFDPNLHEATFQTPVEGKEDGAVVLTQQKGFLLNGRVLRAAKVGVVKNAT